MLNELLDADLPHGIENLNRAIRGAYMKGRKARLEGKTLAECPYDDLRKPSGKLSWSRSFINTWRDGFRDMDRIASNSILRGEAR